MKTVHKRNKTRKYFINTNDADMGTLEFDALPIARSKGLELMRSGLAVELTNIKGVRLTL